MRSLNKGLKMLIAGSFLVLAGAAEAEGFGRVVGVLDGDGWTLLTADK